MFDKCPQKISAGFVKAWPPPLPASMRGPPKCPPNPIFQVCNNHLQSHQCTLILLNCILEVLRGTEVISDDLRKLWQEIYPNLRGETGQKSVFDHIYWYNMVCLVYNVLKSIIKCSNNVFRGYWCNSWFIHKSKLRKLPPI